MPPCPFCHEPASKRDGRDSAGRGIKTLATGQRFFDGFEALHALRRGHTRLAQLVPGHEPARATVHERVRPRARPCGGTRSD